MSALNADGVGMNADGVGTKLACRPYSWLSIDDVLDVRTKVRQSTVHFTTQTVTHQ